MSEVVSDASPLIALNQIGHLGLLGTLFGAVLIPPAVAREAHRADRVILDELAGRSLA